MGEKEVSWGAIVFAMFIFMPLGLYFLVKKSKTNCAAAIWLIMCGLFNVIMVYESIKILNGQSAEVERDIGYVVFFAIWALLFLILGSINAKRLRKYKNYINYVARQKIYSIDRIATLEKVDYNVAVENLKFLYDNNYLGRESCLEVRNRVIRPKNKPVQRSQSVVNNSTNKVNITKVVDSNVVDSNVEDNKVNISKNITVRCNGCGANVNAVVGSTTECEYCGTYINV